jgi:hypothetical protein
MNIELPYPLTFFMDIKGIYKGEPIIFHDGWAQLNTSESPSVFSLIITEKITGHCNDAGLCTLEIAQSKKTNRLKPVAWYDLTLIKNNDTKSYTWKIISLPQSSIKSRIPEHALVILLPPSLITTITDKHTQHTSPTQFCPKNGPCLPIIELPTLCIKNINQSEFDDACFKNSIHAIDVNQFHRAKTLQVMRTEKSIITQPAKKPMIPSRMEPSLPLF